MKYSIIVFEAPQHEWDEWRKKASRATDKTIATASAVAITGAAGAWLAVLYRLLQSNRAKSGLLGPDKALLSVASLAAAAGVWHFYKIARKIVDKREATELTFKFANQKANVTKEKEDIERAKKWKKRYLKTKK